MVLFVFCGSFAILGAILLLGMCAVDIVMELPVEYTVTTKHRAEESLIDPKEKEVVDEKVIIPTTSSMATTQIPKQEEISKKDDSYQLAKV